MNAKIGIIGGSGFYQMEGLVDVEEVSLDTPFGSPSDRIVIGTLEGKRVAFLPRHGRGHRISPSEINVRANVYALKSIGVEWLISVSAVGSLREDLVPRQFVVPDQFYDHTKARVNTFFGGGLVAHISLSDPFCPVLSDLLYEGAGRAGATVHKGGTYLCMEGPQFSTKAESGIYRKLGFDVIGMTAAPEAKLAREAELCYASFACVTDYDCWHPEHDAVTTEMLVGNLLANVELAKRSVREVIASIPEARTCGCPRALEKAFLTSRDAMPEEAIGRLGILVEKYL